MFIYLYNNLHVGEQMLDKRDRTAMPDGKRIRLLEKDEDIPAGMFGTECFVNAPMFCSITGQNGGKFSRQRYEALFTDGQMIEEFFKLTDGLLPKKKARCSDGFQLAFDPLLYQEMKDVHDHLNLPLVSSGGTFANNLCMFTLGWLGKLLKLSNIDDVRMLIIYINNANPKNTQDVSDAIARFSRRTTL